MSCPGWNYLKKQDTTLWPNLDRPQYFLVNIRDPARLYEIWSHGLSYCDTEVVLISLEWSKKARHNPVAESRQILTDLVWKERQRDVSTTAYVLVVEGRLKYLHNWVKKQISTHTSKTCRISETTIWNPSLMAYSPLVRKEEEERWLETR